MKFIQFTDLHLVPRGEMLHGLDPCKRLEACIADINLNHADAELCVITGDLAQSGQLEAYRDLRDCLSRLELPFHLMVGNHDRREQALEIFPDIPVDPNGFFQTSIETIAGRFVLLDTVEEGKPWGSFCEKRRNWLHKTLEASRERPVYLFMHHPPFPVGLNCVDRIGLGGDGGHIGEILLEHDNIRHLFFGHLHRPISGSWQGIPYSTLRGINHQVPLDFGAVDAVPKSHEPPAYAVIFLEEGQTTIHVHDYLDTYRVPYEKKSEGRPDWG